MKNNGVVMRKQMLGDMARIGYEILFFLLIGSLFYYLWMYMPSVYAGGSPEPTLNQTVPLNSHGKVVYISSTQDLQMKLTGLALFTSLPSMILIGLLLHVRFKVKIYPQSLDKAIAWWKPNQDIPTK
jgi:hypothetical protein